MYDMYHWHRIDAGTDDSARRATAATAPRPGETQAGEIRDGQPHRAAGYRGTRAHRSTPARPGVASHHAGGTSPGSGTAAGRACRSGGPGPA